MHKPHAGPCLPCRQMAIDHARWLGGDTILSLQSPMTISRAEEAITEVLGYPKNIPGLVHILWGDRGSDLLSEPTCSGNHGGQKSCIWVSSDCTVVISLHKYGRWFTDWKRDFDGECSTCGDHILMGTPISPRCCVCFLTAVCPICQVHLPGLKEHESLHQEEHQIITRVLVTSLPSISQCEHSRSDYWLCLLCLIRYKEKTNDKGKRLLTWFTRRQRQVIGLLDVVEYDDYPPFLNGIKYVRP